MINPRVTLTVTATAPTFCEADQLAREAARLATTRTLTILHVRSGADGDNLVIAHTYELGLVDRPEDN